MDLSSIINTEGGDSSSKPAAPAPPRHERRPPPPPQQQQQQQQNFREFSHSSQTQASPGKHPQQQPGGHYASPETFQANYPGRPPQPPPIQAPPLQHDLRSPARSYSAQAQSPYQHTPTSSMSSAQHYPFPQSHQTPQSPAQHHQTVHPAFHNREIHPLSNPPPHLQHPAGQHGQSTSAPQTPPVGTPGAPHPYLQHQRSHSSVSTSTPTSAHSQTQYYGQYPHDSPVSAGHSHPNSLQHHTRQPSVHSQHSQPGTPLGPPITQRQSSGGFSQTASPLQQKGVLSGPFNHYQHSSPLPPAPAGIPRQPSTPNHAFDSHRNSTSEQQRRSQSEKERSLSVSPKSQVPSLPRGEISIPQHEVGSTLKRKMDDRDPVIQSLRREEQQAVKPQTNGNRHFSPVTTSSPQQPAKKRRRYPEPPIWAQSVRSEKNIGLVRSSTNLNGRDLGVGAKQGMINGHQPQVTRGGPVMEPANNHASNLLGPWEESITGEKAQDQLATQIADFLFQHVVSRRDHGELASRGVEIEIEAKLGQLINIETNDRLSLPVTSECVIASNYRLIGFKSAMTEAQHRKLNEYLNSKVSEAHSKNPNRPKQRVEIEYVHRRENDKFYELPPSMHNIIPNSVRQDLNPRHKVKVRITHDQKTGEVLAKIIKIRVADLNIYMPREQLDCRISVNLEIRFDGDIGDITAQATTDQQSDRSKDRLSYKHGTYQIDLTQVTKIKSHNSVDHIEKEHELEIEVSGAKVQEQGFRATQNQQNEYFALVEGFTNNIRILSRTVPAA